MNWYKLSQKSVAPISIASYDSNNELGIQFNGGPKIYPYKNVNLYEYNHIRKLLKFKNYKAVYKILKVISENNNKSPLGTTPAEERMLDELERAGLLSPKKKISQVVDTEEEQFIGMNPVNKKPPKNLIYVGIGHETGVGNILWIWQDGRLLQAEDINYNNHEALWGNYKRMSFANWQGRYEVSTGKISIIPPGNVNFPSRDTELPEGLLSALDRAFPEATGAYLFAGSNENIKTSQLIMKDPTEEKRPLSYLDIGHSERQNDIDHMIYPNYMWIYFNNNVLVQEENEDNPSHFEAFETLKYSLSPYVGRYDSYNKRLSITTNFKELQNQIIPKVVLHKLQRTFPEAIYLYRF